MKKLLTLTAVGAILVAPATAVQKCVAFDENTSWSSGGCDSYGGGTSDWCVRTASGIVVRGVAVCGTSVGDFGDVTDTLEQNYYSVAKYCWCKMVSPVASQWVAYGNLDSFDYCQYDCGAMCGSSMESKSAFLSGIMSNLSD